MRRCMVTTDEAGDTGATHGWMEDACSAHMSRLVNLNKQGREGGDTGGLPLVTSKSLIRGGVPLKKYSHNAP